MKRCEQLRTPLLSAGRMPCILLDRRLLQVASVLLGHHARSLPFYSVTAPGHLCAILLPPPWYLYAVPCHRTVESGVQRSSAFSLNVLIFGNGGAVSYWGCMTASVSHSHPTQRRDQIRNQKFP
jgi:hypothetical protein